MHQFASFIVLFLCISTAGAKWLALPKYTSRSAGHGYGINREAAVDEDQQMMMNELREERARLTRMASEERAKVQYLKRKLNKAKLEHEQDQLRAQEVFESEMHAIFNQFESDKLLQEKQIVEEINNKHKVELEDAMQKLSAEQANSIKSAQEEIGRLKAENTLLQQSNSELKNELSSNISHMAKLAMTATTAKERFTQEIEQLKAQLHRSTQVHVQPDPLPHAQHQTVSSAPDAGAAATDGGSVVSPVGGAGTSTRQHRLSRRRSSAAAASSSQHTPSREQHESGADRN